MVFNEVCAQGNFKFSRIRMKFSRFQISFSRKIEFSNFSIETCFQRFLKIEISFEINEKFSLCSSLKLPIFDKYSKIRRIFIRIIISLIISFI